MTAKEINAITYEVITTNINGFDVKVVKGHHNLICAVPCNGRMSSAKWDIISLNDGDNEYLCQLTKKEVERWMIGYVRNHLVAELVANDYAERLNNYEIDVEFEEVFAPVATNQIEMAF